jgi:hypothetical protein
MMRILQQKNKYYIFLGALLFLILGLIAGTFFFQAKNTPPKFAFSPTPTVVPTPKEYRKIEPANNETTSWNEFSDPKLVDGNQSCENGPHLPLG